MAASAASVRACAVAALVALFAGILVIAAGLLVPHQISKALQAGIRESIVWTPTSPPAVDARFRNNTGPGAPPDIFKLWLFNITNLDEVRQGGNPVLQQVGPYVHRAVHAKHDVLWGADGRVQFKDYTYFEFDAELTPPEVDPAANITTFNLALLGVLAMLHGSLSPGLVPFADLLMQFISSYKGDPDMAGLFTVKPAMALLWGYEDRLLAALQPWLPPGTLPDGPRVFLMKNTTSLSEALARNASVFDTGETNISNVWNMESDQGHSSVSSWPCAQPVHGSDASQFRPGLTGAERLTVWVGDIFQPRDLVLHSRVELHGVKLLRYWLDPAQDDPSSDWAACHNLRLRGLMNITTPHSAGAGGSSNASGPPIFVSMPMFCGADPRLAAESGLTCDPEAHSTFVDVEPTTGVTLRAYKRLQVSSQAAGLGAVLDPGVRGNLTIPLFWAEEVVAAPPAAAQQLKDSVYRAQWLVDHLGEVCWIAGGLLLLLGITCAVATVQLQADPDSWPGSAAGRARDMLGAAGGGGGGGRASAGGRPGVAYAPAGSAAAEHYGVVAVPAPASTSELEADDDEQQQLLAGGGGGGSHSAQGDAEQGGSGQS